VKIGEDWDSRKNSVTPMATLNTTTTKIQHPQNNDGFPNPQPARSEAGESILSSQMTDIASEEGAENSADPLNRVAARRLAQRRSIQTTASRPNTGVSSQRGAWGQSQPTRRGYLTHSTAQRGSVAGSIASRPVSATSRSHAPSLTSHAFFRPMSSQRLQAQRGSRPVLGPHGLSEDGSAEGGGSSLARNSVNSNQTTRLPVIVADSDRPPPSRGTEMTEQETAERRTVTTSPTQGHHPTASLTESVRPLQRGTGNSKGLSLNIDKSYKNGNGLPTPSKSPRSFRSSFLLPTRGEPPSNSPNRSNQGREKLASVASSPGLTPVDAPGKPPKSPKLGKNYEYFTGNTVFCWGGRLQNTRDKPISIATGSFVVIPSVLFFAFSAPWLWHNISPAIPIFFAYLFYICISSFVHASVTDPGVS
jgi:palmitoyltransferase ZDHHC9/14/18